VGGRGGEAGGPRGAPRARAPTHEGDTELETVVLAVTEPDTLLLAATLPLSVGLGVP